MAVKRKAAKSKVRRKRKANGQFAKTTKRKSTAKRKVTTRKVTTRRKVRTSRKIRTGKLKGEKAGDRAGAFKAMGKRRTLWKKVKVGTKRRRMASAGYSGKGRKRGMNDCV